VVELEKKILSHSYERKQTIQGSGRLREREFRGKSDEGLGEVRIFAGCSQGGHLRGRKRLKKNAYPDLPQTRAPLSQSGSRRGVFQKVASLTKKL